MILEQRAELNTTSQYAHQPIPLAITSEILELNSLMICGMQPHCVLIRIMQDTKRNKSHG
jgi:hypothetical protein